MRTIIIAALVALASVVSPPVAAQATTATVDELVVGLLSISKQKCQGRGLGAAGFEREGKLAEARSVRIGEANLCDCMPARLQALREQLTPAERSQRVSGQEFMKNYAPRYMNACASESLRQTYGSGCAETVAARKANGPKYCACMSAEVSRYTDAEAVQLGQESADYTQAAAEARKRGQAAPPQPPMIARMAVADATCSKP